MGSVFLAAKVEECPIRFLDLVNVFDHLIKKFHRLPLDPMPAYQQVSTGFGSALDNLFLVKGNSCLFFLFCHMVC
jgi:hypothetical protein